MSGIILVLVAIMLIVLAHDAYVIMRTPRCPDCKIKAKFEDDGWNRWYCPKCHKRV